MDTREEDVVKRAVEEQREAKDRHFKSAHWSPIPERERPGFKALNYYPYDPGCRVTTRFHRNPNPDTVVMTTSKGDQQTFLRYGAFTFQLGGRVLQLTAYKAIRPHSGDEESLFVPFRDGTSGKETYGAARYLDIPEQSSGDYVIDFNLAYNPYCAYSEDYVCPLPPRENWLDAPIRAGEKNYHPRKGGPEASNESPTAPLKDPEDQGA